MHGGGFSRRDMHRMARSAGRGSNARRPDVEMTILEEIPAALQDQLKNLLDGEEEVKIAISTDLQFNGSDLPFKGLETDFPCLLRQ